MYLLHISHYKEVEEELEKESVTLQEADVSGLQIMKWCSKADIAKTQSTIDEYQILWKDINERLKKLKKSSPELEIKNTSIRVSLHYYYN